LREENQNHKIERLGHLSQIAELKGMIARLEREAESMRAAIAALPIGGKP